MIRPLIRRRTFIASGAAVVAGFGTRSPAAVAAPPIVSLNAILQQLRARHLLPGAAALVLRSGWTIAQGVAGRRSAFEADPIRRPDQFLIGSCGKSMTATVVARLVQQGAITFETTLAELFPELRGRMWPGYRSVSLAALLAHRGGVPAVPPLPLPLGDDPAAARAVALPIILALPPVGTPGQTYLYSNLGYIVVGAALDRVAGIAFERLAARELFGPLGLGTAGFSAPTGADAPSGHTALGIPLPPDSLLYPPSGANPAGLYHLSLPDWAKYARLHMGLGPGTYLSATLLARLQRPWVGPGPRYALGWEVATSTYGKILRHDGSDGYWSARTVLIPGRDYGLLMATNILSPGAERAADELEALLFRRFPPA